MHHVYVAKMRGILRGVVKIGYSTDVAVRMRSIRGMLVEAAILLGVKLSRDPEPLVMRVLSFRQKAAAEVAERDLKAHYWRFRLKGEYFRLPGKEIAKLARKGHVERILRAYAKWDEQHGPKTLADFVALGLVEAKAIVYVNWSHGDAMRTFQVELRRRKIKPPPPEACYLNQTPCTGEKSPLLPWTGWVTVRPLCGSIPKSIVEELRKVSGKTKMKKASQGGIRMFSNKAFLYVASLGVWDKNAQQANRSRVTSGLPALDNRSS